MKIEKLSPTVYKVAKTHEPCEPAENISCMPDVDWEIDCQPDVDCQPTEGQYCVPEWDCTPYEDFD